jgi:hypothetical protein
MRRRFGMGIFSVASTVNVGSSILVCGVSR